MNVEQNVASDGDAMPEWRLRYAFADRFGTECEGETEWGPAELVDSWAAGDAGTVQFDPRDPGGKHLAGPRRPSPFTADP